MAASSTVAQHKDSFWRGVGVGAFVGLLGFLGPWAYPPIGGLLVMPMVWLLSYTLFFKSGGFASCRGKIAAAIGGAVCVATYARAVLSFDGPFLSAIVVAAGALVVPAILIIGAGLKRMAWGYGVSIVVWTIAQVAFLLLLLASFGLA
ncbi:MAG: hypothetical protein HY681_05280 [Chloroflexi bacterium]|nr:hypothetical protein [Chloroflexota bacterium]